MMTSTSDARAKKTRDRGLMEKRMLRSHTPIRAHGFRLFFTLALVTLIAPGVLGQEAETNVRSGRPSNESLTLTPRIEFDGPNLEFDFPGLLIGAAEYDEGPTGCTVFYFEKRAQATADVRGGAPGTIEIGRLIDRVGPIDAICFAGGSAYGVAAATGVQAELLERRGFRTGWMDIALVSGAIIFDFTRRDNAIYPDGALGRAALKAARPGVFPLGARGAGRSASVGADRESSGQGAAFRQVGPTKIAVFTIVNAAGVVVDREGKVVRGNLDRRTGERKRAIEQFDERRRESGDSQPGHGNTTLTLVVTNQKLGPRELGQLANQVHSSMARAIQPFHTLNDGDVLFAVTTDEVVNPSLHPITLATVASELAWDAVLSAVASSSRD